MSSRSPYRRQSRECDEGTPSQVGSSSPGKSSRMKSFTTLALLYAVKICCVQVHGRYLLEIGLNRYDNRDGRCIGCPRRGRTHSCCDDHSRSNNCDRSDRPCDSYFIFCLRGFGAQRERYDCQAFYNDTKITSVNNNDGPVDFTNKTVLGLENPFLLQGLTEKYEGVQLYISVYDRDVGTNNQQGANEPDDLVDIVVTDHNQPVGVQSQTHELGTFVSINLIITTLCAQNFGGPDCTQCVPGFTGANCEVNIDDCVGFNCSGNGQCMDAIGSSSCDCDPGFTGEFCETNIDDCVGVNCSGNGECLDRVNSFICECMTGYSGLQCNQISGESTGTSSSIIIGGVVGGVVTVIILLALVLILVVLAVLSVRYKNTQGAKTTSGHVHVGVTVSGDNPVYSTGNTTISAFGSPSYDHPAASASAVHESHKHENKHSIQESPRKFDNPIYGDDETDDSVYTAAACFEQEPRPDHEFDNPIYGTGTDDENAYSLQSDSCNNALQ